MVPFGDTALQEPLDLPHGEPVPPIHASLCTCKEDTPGLKQTRLRAFSCPPVSEISSQVMQSVEVKHVCWEGGRSTSPKHWEAGWGEFVAALLAVDEKQKLRRRLILRGGGFAWLDEFALRMSAFFPFADNDHNGTLDR